MTVWVEVNGAKIQKKFFDANVAEAKEYDWTLIRPSDVPGHTHCMICNVAIGNETSPSTGLYTSKTGHLCAYCHDRFINIE
jgi:hypothetical protein